MKKQIEQSTPVIASLILGQAMMMQELLLTGRILLT